MENNVIRLCHDDFGHVEIDKVYETINRTCWFPQMRQKIKDHISNCLKCIYFSVPSGKTEGHLHNIPKGNLSFQTIHIDHYGPLEKSGKGYKYIFSIIDYILFYKIYQTVSM